MKKILCLLALLLLLTGCQSVQEPTAPPPTEASVPTLLEQGKPWDEAGTLTELPLSVPQGWHCGQTAGLDGEVLVWSVDDHREAEVVFRLCLMDLVTGQTVSQREITLTNNTTPQILEDQI